MFLTLSLMLTPIILVGVVMSAIELFQFFKRHPGLGLGSGKKAGMVVFFLTVLSVGLMVAPHRITSPLGWFSYVITATYVIYLLVGVWFCWKWFWMIKRTEDTDPTNDLKEPEDCGAQTKSADDSATLTTGRTGDGITAPADDSQPKA